MGVLSRPSNDFTVVFFTGADLVIILLLYYLVPVESFESFEHSLCLCPLSLALTEQTERVERQSNSTARSLPYEQEHGSENSEA